MLKKKLIVYTNLNPNFKWHHNEIKLNKKKTRMTFKEEVSILFSLQTSYFFFTVQTKSSSQ